jgi:hypothetical protein
VRHLRKRQTMGFLATSKTPFCPTFGTVDLSFFYIREGGSLAASAQAAHD